MSKTAKEVMTTAISYLGVKENPAGSNNVKFNTDYYGKAVSGDAYPWCAVFCWDMFRLSGASDLFYDGKKTAYCPTVESWGKQRELTIDKTKGQYGDIVLFDFSNKGIAGHIGLIESKNADGTYTCIEGNTSLTSNDNGGCVMRRTRNVSVIRCIIRPKYAKETASNASTSQNKTTKKVLPPIANPTLRKGSKGTQTQYLQKDLNYVGYSLTVDGIFGTATEKALKSFQKKYKLTVDGIYGLNTRAKLGSLIK